MSTISEKYYVQKEKIVILARKVMFCSAVLKADKAQAGTDFKTK